MAWLQVLERVAGAMAGMGKAITCPQIWKPSLFMFLSISLAVSTHEGHFYWYTDSKTGPAFSQVICYIPPCHKRQHSICCISNFSQ